jgi:SAM-dependent methyltransferase
VSDSAAALRTISDALRDECGCSGWLAFDSLMSATQRRLLDADGPLSLAVLADEPGRVAAMRQSFRIVRGLRRAGLEAEVAGDGRCAVAVEAHGVRRTVSVQACWQIDDKVVFAPGLPARAGADAVLPVAETRVDGTPLPVPADPARVLTATYGEHWRTQQPPYQLRPRAVAAAADPARGYGRHRRHWDRFYRGVYGVTPPREPSPFGLWVAGRERERDGGARPLVLDVGCGNGRDSRHFAEQGHRVLAVDYSPAALACARELLGAAGALGETRMVDLSDLRPTLLLGAETAALDLPVVLYARFLAHAVDDCTRDNLWRLASTALRHGGRMYLEFRTTRDESSAHVFEDQHERRFLDPEEVDLALKHHGGAVVHREEGRGLAPYRSEDPHICRMVVQWAR